VSHTCEATFGVPARGGHSNLPGRAAQRDQQLPAPRAAAPPGERTPVKVRPITCNATAGSDPDTVAGAGQWTAGKTACCSPGLLAG